jgi:hypothetical protein
VEEEEMSGVVSIKLDMANDGSALTLTMLDIDGPPIAHATFNAKQLRPLVVSLTQALAHLEGNAPPPGMTPGDAIAIPSPTPLPAWRLAQLDTGEPVIAVEIQPRLWTSFSLSRGDGMKVASLLQEMLGH